MNDWMGEMCTVGGKRGSFWVRAVRLGKGRWVICGWEVVRRYERGECEVMFLWLHLLLLC